MCTQNVRGTGVIEISPDSDSLGTAGFRERTEEPLGLWRLSAIWRPTSAISVRSQFKKRTTLVGATHQLRERLRLELILKSTSPMDSWRRAVEKARD